MAETGNKDQQHPLHGRDRQLVNSLLTGEINDLNLAELARLRIRYRGFPGARDIQKDLDTILRQWNLTENALFERTRQIHATSVVYKIRSKRQDEEDWN